MNRRITPLLPCIIFVFASVTTFAAAALKTRSSAEAAQLVAAGKAVLVDVRDADKVADSMLAAPAYALPLTDLQGPRTEWKPFLATHRDKEIIVYCSNGRQSAQAAAILAAEGFTVSSAGTLSDWRFAELPVRDPEEPRR